MEKLSRSKEQHIQSCGGMIENETSTEGAGGIENTEKVLRLRLEIQTGPQVMKRLDTIHSAREALGVFERSHSIRFLCQDHSRENELKRIRNQ